MSAPLTLPQARIPLGWVMVGGQRAPVSIDIEWMRALLGMLDRTGGVTGSNGPEELATFRMEFAPSDPMTQEAMRAVDELRNELSSARTEIQSLRSQIEEVAAQLAEVRPYTDLTTRVTQIEERLQ